MSPPSRPPAFAPAPPARAMPGEAHAVTDLADLRRGVPDPSRRSATKVVDRLDEAKIRFISLCPLVLLATAGPGRRSDVSPRGGPPGFVTVLDERHVALADLGGNNRLDSYTNIVGNPEAGLLFVVPTRDETLRVNGPALLTRDPAVLDRCHPGRHRPASRPGPLPAPAAGLALVVETAEVYGHCTKAFRRARLWSPGAWEAFAGAPDYAEMYAAQTTGADTGALRAELAADTDRALNDEGAAGWPDG